MSFSPSSVVEEPPFEVSEVGWGEFQVGLKVYFHEEASERPVDLHHQLRLFPDHPQQPNVKVSALLFGAFHTRNNEDRRKGKGRGIFPCILFELLLAFCLSFSPLAESLRHQLSLVRPEQLSADVICDARLFFDHPH